MKCYIVKDLLPSYIDGITSEETTAEITLHIENCTECKSIYEKLTQPMQNHQTNLDEANFLKGLRRKISSRNTPLVIVTTTIALFVIGYLFAYIFVIHSSIPFDAERIQISTIETYVAYEKNEYGNLTFFHESTSPNEIFGDREFLFRQLQISHKGFAWWDAHISARSIVRDGQNIRVVFFTVTQAPIARLLPRAGNYASFWGYKLHGDVFHEPQMIEVYYLHLRPSIRDNLAIPPTPNTPTGILRMYNRIDEMSDENFDNLRHNATLVFSGVVDN
ncbi:MAG: zf-HC2 domain-containing protein [Defluviitaleaceae bacterium]|nr:zf-HC2 domain-containing protein [Defluviitaleaceae bacterium]